MAALKENGKYYLDTDNDSLLEYDLYKTYNRSEGVFGNTAMNSDTSETSFKVDENEVSVTRKMGRKYSIMSFVPSDCNTKVDIVVTQGRVKPVIQTEVYIPSQEKLFTTYGKSPKPPWFAKLCLGFVFLFVIAMMVIAIIVFVSTHSMDKDITVTIEQLISLNVSDSRQTPVSTMINSSLTPLSIDRTETAVS